MQPAVEVRDLFKAFVAREKGKRTSVAAVDRVSFAIAPGERVAFVGPNGAGKSTTVKMLVGILRPDAGEISVLGREPWRERKKLALEIGTVFGQRSQLFLHLPAEQSFRLLARVYEQDGAAYVRRKEALTEAFGLHALLKRPVRALSLGERMRCELAASLLHAPRILFLDEPTIGLDVTAKAILRDVVRERSARDGCTVLLTSHDTGDMEQVCDRVLVLNRGRLLLDRSVGDLRTGYIRKKRVTLLTAERDLALDLPGVTWVERSPHRAVLELDVSQTPVEAVVGAALKASRLHDLTVEDPPMEEIVQAIYARGSAS